MRARTLAFAAIVFVAAFLLSVGPVACGSTGSKRFGFVAAAGGVARDASRPYAFTNDAGWTITLTKATVTMGPVYLNVISPLHPEASLLPRIGVKRAYGADALGEGRVVGQVLSQLTFDALSPELVAFPQAGSLAQEEVRTAEIWYWPPPGVSPETTAISQPALAVAGEAVRGGERVRFRGDLVMDDTWAPEAKPGERGVVPITELRKVRGIPAQFFPTEGGGLEIRFDVKPLFRGADFAALSNNPTDPDGTKVLVQSKTGAVTTDQVMRNLYQGLKSTSGTYAVRWVPGGVDAAPPDAGAANPGEGSGIVAGPGGFLVSVSGEDLAVRGYDFGAGARANGDPPAFVDGWSLRFDHVIVTVADVRLASNPDTDPANPELTGPVVATRAGPWAIDLHLGGDVPGKSGSPDERAVAIAAIDRRDDGAAFDPTQRYAFSYALVAATPSASLVNLDEEGKALYERAKANGWAMIYAGTATFEGPPPAPGSPFAAIPRTVRFTLGMANPTHYVNCQNTDLAQLASGEFPRGVEPHADRPTIAQITFHTDHAFWSALNVEGTELHFDAIAAQASPFGAFDATGAVTMDDLAPVDLTAVRTRAGAPLPWRSLVPDWTAPGGTLSFDANGTTFQRANSYASFVRYSASAGGHLNADGVCKVKNDFVP